MCVYYFKKYIVLMLAIVLVSCGGGGDGGNNNGGGVPPTPPPIPHDANSNLPSDNSVRLYYNNDKTASIFGAAKKIGADVVDVLIYPTDVREYYSVTPQSIFLRGFFSPSINISGVGDISADIIFDKNILLWSWDMSPNDISSYSGPANIDISPVLSSNQKSFAITRTYHGIENIVVPYGTFQATHISINVNVNLVINGVPVSIPWIGDIWFASGIGIIKRVENGVVFNLTQYSALDSDGDGMPDSVDPFPNDPAEVLDTDGDGLGNNVDTDDDNDGVSDANDALPLNPKEWQNTDGDGIGNNADLDDDGDGYADTIDAFPLDKTEWFDTDGDGIGNNADLDDDGDGYPDAIDVFPLDKSEWIDSDGDGIGDNADPNDDNDRLLDIDDPRPLDPNAPGLIYSMSPGSIIAGKKIKINVTGDFFSNEDTFYLDNVQLNKNVISKNVVELEINNPVAGQNVISIQYAGHNFRSSVSIAVKDPIYYPYASIPIGGGKPYAYFDPVHESLYVYNYVLSEVTRFQYVTGQGWVSKPLTIFDLKGVALSPDLKHLAAFDSGNLIEINGDSMLLVASHPISRLLDAPLMQLQFDYSNKAVLMANINDRVIFYNLESLSSSFGTQTSGESFLSPFMSASGDGSLFIMGSSNYNDFIYQYLAKTNSFVNTLQFSRLISVDLNRDGSKIIINNTNIYNSSFNSIGQLEPNMYGAKFSPDGDFLLAISANGEIKLYDTTNLNSQQLTASYSATINENIGGVYTFVISEDQQTVFIIGLNRILVVPMWQIIENKIGSAQLCPTSGCGSISVSQGVPPPLTVTPKKPVFDNLNSPLKHVSPVYAGVGHQFEVVLNGSGFTPASVVQFGDVLATQVNYVSDTELRVKLPVLTAGTYTVTVDGHQGNAPKFSVYAQAPILAASWPLGGYPRRLIYHPGQNALYHLDRLGSKLSRINLADNTVVTQVVTNAQDMTWCPEDGYLYLTNGSQIMQFDTQTLQYTNYSIATKATTLECTAENNLIFANNGFSSFKYYDRDTNEVFDSYTSTNNQYGILSDGFIDGISARGDRIYFGEVGNNASKYVMFMPHTRAYSYNTLAQSFTSFRWSADGSIGVNNAIDVYDYNLTYLGQLGVAGVVKAVVVTPDGSKIYAATDDLIVHVINIDPANPTELNEDAAYPLTSNVGSIIRMESSLDGKTVFVGGLNGIEALKIQ